MSINLNKVSDHDYLSFISTKMVIHCTTCKMSTFTLQIIWQFTHTQNTAIRPLLHGSVKLTDSHPKGVRQNAWYLLHRSVKSCV